MRNLNCLISIGNFDGVHLGHQKLLKVLVNKAKETGVKSKVITFDPHPKAVLNDNGPRLLYDLETRIKAIKSFGVDEVQIIEFSESLAKMRGEEFLEKYVSFENMTGIVQGKNFKFGFQGGCDIECLQALGQRYDFLVEVINLELDNSEEVSSSKIRSLLAENKISNAYELFGGHYFYNYEPTEFNHSMVDQVVHGNKYGRIIETPTANLSGIYAEIPSGVYAGLITLPSGEIKVGAISVHDNQVEVHVIDWSGDLYDLQLKIDFKYRLRPYVQFKNQELLIAQIKRDLLISWGLIYETII